MSAGADRKVSMILQDIAQGLDAVFEKAAGERVAFTLFVWTEGRAQYISSAERAEVRKHIADLFEIWDQSEDDPPSSHLLAS